MSALATQGVHPASAEDVRAALGRVLARDEFRPRERSIWDWLGERFTGVREWLADFFDISFEASGALLEIAGYVLLGAVLLYVGFVVGRAFVGRTRGARDAELAPADDQARRAAHWRALGRAAQQRGDLVEALRLYFRALVIGLSERGDLEYREAWTNRELLERGAPRADVARVLRPMIPDLDAQSFGHAPLASADVERMARLCDQYLEPGA